MTLKWICVIRRLVSTMVLVSGEKAGTAAFVLLVLLVKILKYLFRFHVPTNSPKKSKKYLIQEAFYR